MTPCQIKSPASVTTNDGTPTLATTEPWAPPMNAHRPIAIAIATTPGYAWPLPGSWNSATARAAIPLRYPIERSISPSRRTKTTPKASMVKPAIWTMMLLKLSAVKKFVATHVAAEAQDCDPRGDLEDVVEVVRDEHDCEALVGEALDEVEDLARLRDAERRGGLVENDDLGVPLHGLGDGDRLPLAPRQRGHRLTDRADGRDGQRPEGLGGALLHERLFQAPEPVAFLAAQVHVLHHVEVVAECEILVDDLYSQPGRVLWAADVNGLPIEQDLAAVRAVDA